MKTSVIVSCFNNTKTAAHMSMLCIDHIRKFTDEGEYKLVVIDPTPKYPIRDDYKTLFEGKKDYNHVKLDQDPGYTKGMNLGAQYNQDCEILVFLQNDVFVREGWLKDLRWYIENGWDAVWPDQVPRDRQYVLDTYERKMDDPESLKGGRDAGLLMITRDAFNRTGGWNEELSLLAEKDFFGRMKKGNVNATDTNKVLITHIMAATNLDLLVNNPDEYNRRMGADADKLNG